MLKGSPSLFGLLVLAIPAKGYNAGTMRLARMAALFLMCSCFAPFTAQAQQPTFHDALLDHLVGRWSLEGMMAGKNTVHDVEASWVLGHQYLRVHEISREKTPAGTPAYEATFFIGWSPKSGQYVGVWLDVYGGISPASLANGKREGDEISFVFQAPDSPFHTTFVYKSQSDTWEMRMDQQDKGKLSPFARVTLTRKK